MVPEILVSQTNTPMLSVLRNRGFVFRLMISDALAAATHFSGCHN
jgi:hypothetical protein